MGTLTIIEQHDLGPEPDSAESTTETPTTTRDDQRLSRPPSSMDDQEPERDEERLADRPMRKPPIDRSYQRYGR